MAKAFKCDACGFFSVKIPWHVTIGKPHHITDTKEYEICDTCKAVLDVIFQSSKTKKENDNE